MPSFATTSSGFLLVWLASKLAQLLYKSKPHAPFPPGPRPKPVIGNMLDFPVDDMPRKYVEWGEKYHSDLLYASSLGNHVLIINKKEDADELLERRASKYSSRPIIPIIKLMGWGYNFGIFEYGDEWRRHRRITHQLMRAEAVRNYYPLVRKKVHNLLQSLSESPEDFVDHYRLLSIAVPMASMYGYDVESFDDPCIVAAEGAILLGLELFIPGASLINLIPALAYIPAWFPGASSHKKAAEVRRLSEEMERIPMEFVKKRVKEGTAVPSFVSSFLDKTHATGDTAMEDERVVQNIASTVYGAASPTTSDAIATFFYTMAANPEIQRKAQEEIDGVVGSMRLPDFEDIESLPYVEAIYREVLRFRPPVPLGVAHALTEDDYYRGYFIPKGTTVLTNIWAMTHDKDVYPEPLKFKPERFFDENGKLNDDRILAYGFGRRICVGKHVASSVMWLVVASVLASFNIGKAKDEFGNEIEIDHGYTSMGNVDRKNEFKCSIVARSLMAQQLIDDTRLATYM